MTLQSRGMAIAGQDDLAREIRALAPWFHNLHLPDGRQTAPDHPLGDFPAFKWAQIEPALPDELGGLHALDIGCNAGYYSIALAQRGACVLGIDVDPHYLRQAEWARERFGVGPEHLSLRQMQVYDLVSLPDKFDLVLFLGVLYHLRHPLLALDIVAEKVDGVLILQTLTMPGEEVAAVPPDLGLGERERMLEPGWPKMAFIERRLEDDPTNWWAPNRACVEAMLRSSGFEPLASPGHEIHVARRAASPQREAVAELRAIFPRCRQLGLTERA
jgi:tRNA (mo5U34)-methyltransferase